MAMIFWLFQNSFVFISMSIALAFLSLYLSLSLSLYLYLYLSLSLSGQTRPLTAPHALARAASDAGGATCASLGSAVRGDRAPARGQGMVSNMKSIMVHIQQMISG